MRSLDLLLLLLLAAIWGASFLFIKVAVKEMSPVFLASMRLAIGAAGLSLIYRLVTRRSSGPAKPPGAAGAPLWARALVLGLAGGVVPYVLIAWGEIHINSGAASILNATSPLFSALFGHFLGLWGEEERLSWTRGLGLGLGIAGVAALSVSQRDDSASAEAALQVLGCLAVVGGSASYAVGALYARLAFAGSGALLPATAQNVGGVAVLLPFGLLFARPDTRVSLEAAGAVLALGGFGTVLAYVLYYRVMTRLGATGVLSVTYLLPGFALVYGAAFLGEAVTAASLASLAMVLAGVALTTGIVRAGRQPERAAR